MRVSIIDWTYRNLRIGQGDESIKLGDPPKRWSLVQMPNGTGKTTTMELIRAVLGGREFTAKEVRSFRANDNVTEGKFELGLLIQETDNGPMLHHRLTVTFDFGGGTYKYSTLRPAERGGGRDLGRVLPENFAHLLRPDFIKLFVFDGELARDIRDLDKRAADQAIKTLYQLDEIGGLRRVVANRVAAQQDAASDLTTGKTQKAVSRHRNAVNEAQTELDRLKKEINELKTTEKSLETEMAGIDTKIAAHIAAHGDLQAEKSKIDREKNALGGELQEAITEALRAFRNPVTLSHTVRDGLTHLGKILTEARLPKSVSSEFFIEMSQQDKCICGREIGEAERQVIIRGKEQYLAKDQISAISTMKDRLNASGVPELTFATACETLQEKTEHRKAIEKRYERLLQKLDEQSDNKIADIHSRHGEISNELIRLKDQINKLETSDPVKQGLLGCTEKTNIPLARKYFRECDEILKTVTKSFRLSRQRDILLSHLERIEAHALASLREIIREETNKRLKSLIQMEDLQVARIDGALQLTSDKVEERINVSEGQSLSVAYAFLTSLLAEAPFDLPFVVDSPAVSLDLDVRREVSKIIPYLFHQMILFVISSEQADFAETFYERDDTHFVCLRKNGAGGVDCVYGLEEFRKRIEETPSS